MTWNDEKKEMSYTDERITIRSVTDNTVLFTGILRDLVFMFCSSPDNLKENNTVECSLMGLAEQKFYPFHILGPSEVCREHYDNTYEPVYADIPHDRLSQHTYSFEKEDGNVLLTARLIKDTPDDWFETLNGGRRRRPPYDLRNHEKTQGAGYADNIYLNPIKQLIAAGMKNYGRAELACDIRDWYYTLEYYIAEGQFTYPDGRVVITETARDHYWHDRKLLRPGMIVRDYIEIGGRRIWYVAEYTEDSNDEQAEASLIFESDYTESALLRFEGSFIRQSIARPEKTPGKVRGYIAYYRITGIISTVGCDGGEVSESIDLYDDPDALEGIAVSASIPAMFPASILNEAHSFTANKHITAAGSVGLDDLVGLKNVKQTFAEFKKFGEYKRLLTINANQTDDDGDMLLGIYKQPTRTSAVNKNGDEAISFHMAFMGSPGTAKSTVAERIASMLKEYGLGVSNEVPLIVVKSDLVGPYIGHTEEIVRKKIDEAMGGILFIDEAYTLFESDDSHDFGKIALNEIMYAMEHRRDKLVVILAGYTDEMLYMLKHANPGLISRISWYFFFDDYTHEEMWQILVKKVEDGGYAFNENDAEIIKAKTLSYFAVLKQKMDGIKVEGKTKHFFGNGRGVRTFYQYMQIGLAVRLANNEGDDDLRVFTAEEVDFAYDKFIKEPDKLANKKENKIGFNYS